VLKYKGNSGGDLLLALSSFVSPSELFSTALGRKGSDASNNKFSYGLESYTYQTGKLVFDETPTGAAATTNINFQANALTTSGFGAGLTLVSKGIDIFTYST
jgi:hypothetical protein